MPKEIAKRMSSEMKEWIQWQLEIYAEPLQQFREKYPEQLLRIHYLDHLGELALPMKKETFPIRELFTELILVSDKDIKKELIPEVDSFKETIHRLEHSSQKISLDRLFEHHRKILLLGRAGIGKSTLCQKMAHDWASGKLWNDFFDVVYWIPLRQLNDFPLKDTFLDTAIPHLFLHPFDPSKKTLLILDGYDEATDELAKRVDHLLGTSPFHILVTSRPGKVDQLMVDQKVENIGFSDQQIQTYINYFSSRHQKEITPIVTGKELFTLIKENPSLYPIAHIPLQLQMILSLYEKTGSVKQASSLTNLYQIMTSELYDWYLRGQKKEEKEEHFLRFGKIAYLGLQTGKLIIPHKKVQYLMQDSLLESGILKKIHGAESAYCFVHLTFQEYLTALYIHLKPIEKQQKFILENRHKPNYQLVLAFLAGLNYSKTQNIEWFFSTLYQKSNTMTLSLSYLLELTLRCLNECIGFDKPLFCLDVLIQENPEIWDTTLSDGYTPSLSAANQRQNQAFYWLANRYPHLMDKTGVWVENKEAAITPFLISAEKGNLEILQWMTEKNPLLVSKCVNDGRTPLHMAAYGGHVQTIKFLLDKDPLLISKYLNKGITPFHFAAYGGDVEAMKFLLEKDPQLISKCDQDGYTPFHSAASGGRVEAMKFLLEKDPQLISKCDQDGRTPFHWAAYIGHVEAMKFLLEKDPQLISKYGNDGTTPLLLAAYGGHVEAMKFLLEKDPQLISKYHNDGRTPLLLAALKGHVETMRFLLDKDPRLISKCDNDGRTPLHEAAFGGHVEAMRLLLEKDPLLTSKCSKNGGTPLLLAAYGGHVEAMKFLLEKDPQLISKYHNDGRTPLLLAALKGHVETMRFLLDKDPRLISKCDNDGRTPLHEAAFGGHVEAMRLLLEKDPQLTSKCSKNGGTPLHAAASGGHVEAGKYLFEQQPSLLNTSNNMGKTALAIAEKRNKPEFVTWIQSVGGIK